MALRSTRRLSCSAAAAARALLTRRRSLIPSSAASWVKAGAAAAKPALKSKTGLKMGGCSAAPKVARR